MNYKLHIWIISRLVLRSVSLKWKTSYFLIKTQRSKREESRMPQTDVWALFMPVQRTSEEDKTAGDENHRRQRSETELVWAVSTTQCRRAERGVKDSAAYTSPALLDLHLAHPLHSYRKISADLPSCAGMALMEWGSLIRDGRPQPSVFGLQQVQRDIYEPCPHARTEHTFTYMLSHTNGQLINLRCFQGEVN